MANLNKIHVPIDIHSNTNETFDFIDANLPKVYSKLVYDLLPENIKNQQGFMRDYIRKVKKDRINNAVIISYLYLVAQRNLDAKQNN